MRGKYIGSCGEVYPGVTTILGILAKPALIHWAWDLGMKGIDYRKERDKAMDGGTLTHEFIRGDLLNLIIDTSDYSKNIIDKANAGFSAYLEWKKLNNFKAIRVEEPIVSEELRVGGTPDTVGTVNDYLSLIDYKTGKGEAIYPEYKIQVLVYAYMLLKVAKIKVEKVYIHKIDRDEGILTPVEVSLKLMPLAVKLFKGLRVVYDNQKYFGK